MVQIRLGGGVQDIRGSLGGQTFRKGRSGHLLQSRSHPVNKRSNRQNKSRAIFQKLTSYWSNSLTVQQREGWAVYATAIDTTNRIGETVKLTGFLHFVRSNALREQFGDFIINDAPTKLTLAEADTLLGGQFNFVTQKLIVFFDESLDWVTDDTGHIYMTMSQPTNPGVRNRDKSFRLAGAVHGSSSAPPTSPQEVDSPYPVALGHVAICKSRIGEGDGRLSNFFLSANHTCRDTNRRPGLLAIRPR